MREKFVFVLNYPPKKNTAHINFGFDKSYFILQFSVTALNSAIPMSLIHLCCLVNIIIFSFCQVLAVHIIDF